MTESIKTYRAVVEWQAYSFEEAAKELTDDGYSVKSLTEVEG